MNNKNIGSIELFPRFIGESLKKYMARVCSTKEGLAFVENKTIRELARILGYPTSTIADAVGPYKKRQKNKDKTIEKTPSRRTLRSMYLSIHKIECEIMELKAILAKY